MTSSAPPRPRQCTALPADGKPRRAAELVTVRRRRVWFREYEAGGYAVQKGVDEGDRLQARQVGAQAVVAAISEGEVVACVRTINVEAVRVVECRRISVGAGNKTFDPSIRRDQLSGELGVANREPSQRHDRGLPAQRLLDRTRE